MDHAVKRIAAGDFDAHICVQGHDEIASLALSVNDMAGRIKQYKASSLGELLQANDRLRSVMDSLADAVIVYDIAGMPVTQNKVAQDLFGPGETSLDEFPEPLRGVIADAFDRVRRERDAHMPTSLDAAVELEGRRGPTWVIVSSTPVIRHDGLLRGVTISLRDVTKARRLDGFRGDLVAATAHELRTPLTSLHMAVHLCLEGAAGPLTERQAGLLTTARDDCQRLQEVVEELLEMARLESGYMRLHRIPMRVVDLVSDAVARHQSEARATGTSIMTDSSEASLTVDVDPERLRHVFDNLLENAMVHGGAQSIISVGFEASDREVRVYVDDGGPGIAPDLRERVFGKFFRVPGTRAPGTGLGLSIVRDVVRAHDGTVGIETSPAGGARMWFSVPRSSNTHV
jgi:PAS domain S-box-containing protein